jgi:hypothetical protein
MNKKRLIWLVVIALIASWGYQQRVSNSENAKQAALQADKLSSEIAAKTQADIDSMMHGLYLNSVCEFKTKLQPVTDMLVQISSKKSIPPDLISELKAFNDSAQFMAMDEKIFIKSSEMNSDEIAIENGIKSFAKEINLKTAELEGGMITASDKYFSGLKQKVDKLVFHACELHKISYPEKYSTPSPTPKANTTHAPGSIDAQIDEIGKQVSYDAICKLDSSGKALLSDVLNAQTSKAFKADLLETSKTSIYDLGYAAFSFNGKSLYTPSPTESHLAPEFEVLKGELERVRYQYWSSGSSSALTSMKSISKSMQELGNSGCIEVKKLKKS